MRPQLAFCTARYYFSHKSNVEKLFKHKKYENTGGIHEF